MSKPIAFLLRVLAAASCLAAFPVRVHAQG